jgi:regulator of PEP synthase PpsR (kinase-PPPase family)
MHQIFIISDGTGRTAEQSLRAALTQFPGAEVNINIRANILNEKQVRDIVHEAAARNGFIIHTVIKSDLRNKILEYGRLQNVETIDLMGPLLAQLSRQFSDSPDEKPGLFHELNKAYFQRIETMEFAFRHDDGQHVEELEKAEIILLGVSRTFKTPLSIYLAFKGWLVANVPLILGIKPPPILNRVKPKVIFGLSTDPYRLSELRRIREKHLGGATGEYAELAYVKQELDYAHQIYQQHPGWSIIDVTAKPIEEIASEILAVIRKENA